MNIDVKTATTAELVSAYNLLTGKAIKKFSSRAAGEKQVTAALANGRAKPAASTEAAKPKRERAAPKPKKTATERAEAIAKSWKDPKVAKARAIRTNVSVDGTAYRSVATAFKALKLPAEKMLKFRMELKASGGHLNFTQEGKDPIRFNIVAAKS